MAQTRAFHGSVETVLFLLLQLLCCLLLGPGLLGREYNDLNVLSDSETEQVKPLCMFLISSIAANRRHLVNRCHTRYTKSSFHYYSNSAASFNFELLRLGGDISLNPGPESCTVCRKVVAKIKGLCVATPALNEFISNAVESHQKSTSDYRLLKPLVGYVLPAWTR